VEDLHKEFAQDAEIRAFVGTLDRLAQKPTLDSFEVLLPTDPNDTS
jgi:hypothetical protein